MIIKFNTLVEEEVQEVIAYLTHNGYLPALEVEPFKNSSENKPVEAPKTVEEPKEVPEPTPEPSIGLKELKELAKIATRNTDRIVVKNIITKYAPKLSDVAESDYEKLAEDLKNAQPA
jgi:hypothetical protein